MVRRSSLEQVKQWTGNYELRPMEMVITDGHSATYAALAKEDVVSKDVRDAAALFVSAEGQLDVGSGGHEVVAKAIDALKLFRTARHAHGVSDSCRLLVHAHCARTEASLWEGDLGGKAEKAIQKAQLLVREELELSQELGDSRSEASMLLSQAELNLLGAEENDENRMNRGEKLKQAGVLGRESASKFEQLQETKMQVVALLAVSRVHYVSGSFQLARDTAQEALAAGKQAKDSRGEALAQLHLVAAQIGSGQFPEALSALGKMPSTASGKDSVPDLAGVPKLRGGLLYTLSRQSMQKDPQAALTLAHEAHSILQGLKYGKGWEAAALGCVVDALVESGESLRAQEAAEAAVDDLKARDTKEAARAMHHLVHAMVANQKNQDAMKVAEDAVDICCQDLADHHSEVVLYLTIAQVYLKAKRYRRAAEAATRAEKALQELGNSEDSEALQKFLDDIQPIILEGEELAIRQLAQEQQQKNQAHKNRILEEPLADYAPDEVGNYVKGEEGVGHARSFLESFASYMKDGDTEKALKAASIAADLFYENEDKNGEAQALLAVAAVHITAENYKLAMFAVKQSLDLYRELHDTGGQAEALHTLASVHNYMQNPKDALLVAHEALGIYQNELQGGHGMLKMYFVIIDSYGLELAGVSQIDRQVKEKHKISVEKALVNAKKAAKLSAQFTELTEGCAQYYLGTAYMLASRHGEAVQAAQEARLCFKKSGEETGQIQAMTMMGEAWLALRKQSKAKEILKEAQRMAKEGAHEQELEAISGLLTQLNTEETLQTALQALPAEATAGWAQAAASTAPAQVLAYAGPDPVEIGRRITLIAKDMTGDEDFDSDTPFMDAGIDSLASVELRTNLQKTFGIPLPSTVMFNYPTRTAIADFIASEMSEGQVSLK